MVKIIDVQVINTYTCQYCYKWFKSIDEMDIILGLSPLCSWICEYRLYFLKLSQYPIETLFYISKLLNLRIKETPTKNDLCYSISTYFTNNRLSNIKEEVQGSGSNY